MEEAQADRKKPQLVVWKCKLVWPVEEVNDFGITVCKCASQRALKGKESRIRHRNRSLAAVGCYVTPRGRRLTRKSRSELGFGLHSSLETTQQVWIRTRVAL